jgi:hypothetical protein
MLGLLPSSLLLVYIVGALDWVNGIRVWQPVRTYLHLNFDLLVSSASLLIF